MLPRPLPLSSSSSSTSSNIVDDDQDKKKDDSSTNSTSSTSSSTNDAVDHDRYQRLRDTLQHSLFPAFKQGAPFFPPTDFLEDQVIVQVAGLERLYKEFERC
jgi:hypothetical protein